MVGKLGQCLSNRFLKLSIDGARTTEQSASSVTQAKSCWKSFWINWSHKWRRSSPKNRQASEQEGCLLFTHLLFTQVIKPQIPLKPQNQSWHNFTYNKTLGSVMTKDWVHGVGHSPVCQILLQIVVRAVITSSPPAWASSAGMLSTPPPLLCEGWGGHSVSVWWQFSTDGSPRALQLYSSEQHSVHRFSICPSVRHFPERSWTVVAFPCFTVVKSFTSWYALLLLFFFRFSSVYTVLLSSFL